jgi:hypothetical protein
MLKKKLVEKRQGYESKHFRDVKEQAVSNQYLKRNSGHFSQVRLGLCGYSVSPPLI